MKTTLQLLLAALILLTSCQKEQLEKTPRSPVKLPATPYNYSNYDLPDHLRFSMRIRFDTTGENRLSDEKATLGRVLFYDTKLSLSNSTACASCHFQKNGFADPNQFSEGHRGELTTRNSMAISNMGFQTLMFWDARANNLPEQVLMPIENHVEMGMEVREKLPAKLAKVDYYPALFTSAFGDETITPERISTALAQFLSSMVSVQTKFDEGFPDGFSNFSALEFNGRELFENKARCSSCHHGQLFNSSWIVTNIGLDKVYTDNGAGFGNFKVPSLRNIELTAPYMHDGRFQTLEEVIEHYNSGIQRHPALDWNLRDLQGNPMKLNLDDYEKTALIAFLKTLTDVEFTKDVRFSDPF